MSVSDNPTNIWLTCPKMRGNASRRVPRPSLTSECLVRRFMGVRKLKETGIQTFRSLSKPLMAQAEFKPGWVEKIRDGFQRESRHQRAVALMSRKNKGRLI